MILKFFLVVLLVLQSSAKIEIPESRNLSEMAIGKDVKISDLDTE
jgi:hypothetical protein